LWRMTLLFSVVICEIPSCFVFNPGLWRLVSPFNLVLPIHCCLLLTLSDPLKAILGAYSCHLPNSTPLKANQLMQLVGPVTDLTDHMVRMFVLTNK